MRTVTAKDGMYCQHLMLESTSHSTRAALQAQLCMAWVSLEPCCHRAEPSRVFADPAVDWLLLLL